MNTKTIYQQKYRRLFPELSERARRLLVAADVKILGYGGVTLVHQASGLSRVTIHNGLLELKQKPLANGRIRRPGGGRRRVTDNDTAY